MYKQLRGSYRSSKTGYLYVGGYDGFRILWVRGEKYENKTDKNASWKWQIGSAKGAWENNKKRHVRVLRCEDGRRREPTRDRVEWPSLSPGVLNLQVMLPSRCYQFNSRGILNNVRRVCCWTARPTLSNWSIRINNKLRNGVDWKDTNTLRQLNDYVSIMKRENKEEANEMRGTSRNLFT